MMTDKEAWEYIKDRYPVTAARMSRLAAEVQGAQELAARVMAGSFLPVRGTQTGREDVRELVLAAARYRLEMEIERRR